MKITFALLAFLMNLPLLAAWTPPENPNPQQILSEAQSDAKAGRYEDALAKHVWFHENALKSTRVSMVFACHSHCFIGPSLAQPTRPLWKN